MNAREFNRRVQAAGLKGRAVDAARLVLVGDQKTELGPGDIGIREAAREIGVDVSIVSRTVARIRNLKLCRACDQPLAESD